MTNHQREVVAILGPGRIGTGIAQACASAGHRVHLIDMKKRDSDDETHTFESARTRIAASVNLLADHHDTLTAADVDAILARITCVPAGDAAAALSDADMVIEAVPERVDVKREVLMTAGAATRDDAIITSTTSTISVNTLATYVHHPQRYLNTHWLNPAELMPLVEVATGAATSEHVEQRVFAFLRNAGKVPVACNGDVPGYIVPRIQALAMMEAERLVTENVATAEAVDTACRLGFGIRFAMLGMLEFIDLGGLDTLYRAGDYLSGALNAPRFTPSEGVKGRMAAGHLGVKSGRGIHDYQDRDVAGWQREKLLEFIEMLRFMRLLPPMHGGSVSARVSAQADHRAAVPDPQSPAPVRVEGQSEAAAIEK